MIVQSLFPQKILQILLLLFVWELSYFLPKKLMRLLLCGAPALAFLTELCGLGKGIGFCVPVLEIDEAVEEFLKADAVDAGFLTGEASSSVTHSST